MSQFKKGNKVALIININGIKTASIREVASVKKGVVSLVDYSLKYDANTGREIEPAFAGFAAIDSEIVKMEE